MIDKNTAREDKTQKIKAICRLAHTHPAKTLFEQAQGPLGVTRPLALFAALRHFTLKDADD